MATPTRGSQLALRAIALVAVVASGGLAACDRALVEDDALAVAPAGIPKGAPDAIGVDFATPTQATSLLEPVVKRPHQAPLPKHLPPDPFGPEEEDLEGDGGAPAMPEPPPKKKGMEL